VLDRYSDRIILSLGAAMRLSALVLLSLSAAPVGAADTPPAALATLRACQGITAAAERLACYDRAAAALNTAVDNKEVIVLDQQDVKRTKRSLFGFTLPRISIFGDGGKSDRDEAEFVQIETTVRQARSLGYGKVSFTTEEGAVWQTTEPGYAMPKPGDKVIIRRAALGSYFIRFERERTVKGMRVG
jgi:hypothetical protein